ncbi:uncharacterized protein LOC131028819 [Cryptomeria japonica]|uniref:uncharacterized protein LOC131028819 n=1 Tax=Cryptomeria japonica TaxID=3369 RepID=UPI0027DA8C36|nr:uncharacterized protein LOC131028819 [Cryptomeria japonica]
MIIDDVPTTSSVLHSSRRRTRQTTSELELKTKDTHQMQDLKEVANAMMMLVKDAKSDPADDEQKPMFIELDVQKDVEQNNVDEDAQPIDEEDEEQEEVIALKQDFNIVMDKETLEVKTTDGTNIGISESAVNTVDSQNIEKPTEVEKPDTTPDATQSNIEKPVEAEAEIKAQTETGKEQEQSIAEPADSKAEKKNDSKVENKVERQNEKKEETVEKEKVKDESKIVEVIKEIGQVSEEKKVITESGLPPWILGLQM